MDELFLEQEVRWGSFMRRFPSMEDQSKLYRQFEQEFRDINVDFVDEFCKRNPEQSNILIEQELLKFSLCWLAHEV